MMGNTSGHLLLNEREAAAVLQPHLSRKSAVAWLLNDRRHDPMIPFVTFQGRAYYEEADVVAFITRVLNPKARFIRVRNHLYSERRSLADRRGHLERRRGESIHLPRGIERRHWGDLDRRLLGSLNRRSRPLSG